MQKFNINNDIKGIEKSINKDGRVLLPEPYRKQLKIKTNDKLEIFLLGNGIFIRKKVLEDE